MNKRFLTLAGVAAVLSIGTFVVLNKAKPYKQEEPKVADVTSANQVFGASVDNPEAHADGASAPAAAGATPAPTEAAAVTPTDTAVQPAGNAAAVVASTGMPEATPAAAPGAVDSAPLVPAEPVGAAPAAATTTDTAAAAPAAEPAAAPAPAPEPAAAPAPAMDTPAAAPAEKPKKKAKKSSHASGKGSKTASAKAWWPAEQANKLSLIYAGHASFKTAVVLMFNGAFFKADTVNANIKVTDKSGAAVSGTWELGENNLRMVVFPVPAAGTYKVTVASGLTDNKGRKLGKTLSGPVVVTK